jgi:hypothetical protein
MGAQTRHGRYRNLFAGLVCLVSLAVLTNTIHGLLLLECGTVAHVVGTAARLGASAILLEGHPLAPFLWVKFGFLQQTLQITAAIL